MKPLTMGFPKRMTIDLPERLRNGLEAIANREPHESDEQLVRMVLGRGIAASLANRLDNLRGSRNGPAVESENPHDIELYVGFPITEDLRDKLEDYLAEHRESDAESIYAALLGLGLQKAEEDPAALDPAGLFRDARQNETVALKRAHRVVRLAERLYLRAQRRCGS